MLAALVGRCFGQDLGNMSAPSFQSVLTFRKKVMSLIDSRNARNCARLVIENFISNMRSNAEPCDSGNTGPAQVVKAPFDDTGELIERSFGLAEFLERFAS